MQRIKYLRSQGLFVRLLTFVIFAIEFCVSRSNKVIRLSDDNEQDR